MDQLRNQDITIVCAFSKSKNTAKVLGLISQYATVKKVYPVSCQHFRLKPADELYEEMAKLNNPIF